MPRSAALRSGVLLCALGLAACGAFEPQPKPWLRYAPADTTGWNVDGVGTLRAECGPALLAIDLHPSQARLLVAAVNSAQRPVQIRVGAQGHRPTDAVGDVIRQPVSGPPSDDVPRIAPFLAHQDIDVRPGWRATFEFDNLLGRDLTIGQYAVLEIEVREPGKPVARRLLPLVATNVQSRGPGR